ncbi:3-deoxy-7-phosphoheptulonate synthase [Alcanivorax sp. JB21]|uniref:3-deoxy-7-phosphoheptulonate synthase n=1 Tax=Alcanivorax limicola TaxID=2874102 RepID=UPI001CBD1E19|nr:3-deoxy-7-phosphoheptulonate synthase [Alcanivorax limicola]MBZ2190125.1 3-deoxy-7-phosphoheptulonate synthase [Alcanivorax limicola]
MSASLHSATSHSTSHATSHTTTSAAHGIRHSLRLPSIAELRARLPLSPALSQQIQRHRDAVRAVLRGEDTRLLVIAGPCSLHDPAAALDYGARLAALADELRDSLLIVMRAYIEKPRTTVGWKGLIYDPHLDGSHDMIAGLDVSRRLLRDLAGLGLPLATELLHPMAAGYVDDLLSWAAIGARTTESQVHREMVSALNLPVGFKNSTDGSVSVAVDAMGAAAHGHRHFGVDAQGHPAMLEAAGNPDTHLVLRGGNDGPNYDAASLARAQAALAQAGVNPRLLVDCSHANSGKNPDNQPAVLRALLAQRRAGQQAIAGVMLESHLQHGRQSADPSSQGNLVYGMSITDGCLGWDSTAALLREISTQV